MGKRPLSYLAPLVGVLVFCAALWVLHLELSQYSYHDIVASLSQIPLNLLLGAAAVTLLSYVVLTGYDFLALRYISHSLPYPKMALASFIGYAFSNNAGLAMLAGSSVRYRLYSAWGLTAFEITKVVAFYTATLWLGLFAVGGSAFILEPPGLPQWLHLPFSSARLIGFLLLLFLFAYLIFVGIRRRPISIRGWEIPVPPLGLSLLQILVSALDWLLAATVLYILLEPSGSPSFPVYLTVFLLGQISGLVSQVPGGLGVFESVVLLGLTRFLPTYSVLASLIAYRLIYYILPLTVAIILLGLHEALAQRAWLARIARSYGEWAPDLTPRVFALMVFVAGATLLFSEALPPAGWRMAMLKNILPLSLVELSHFLGSLIGVGLLLLARGLQLRLDAAHFLTAILLAAGIASSLMKGVDLGEAAILAIVLIMLLPCRKHFYRKASLFTEQFTAGWIASVGIVLLASVWLTFFSFKHVEYSADMWWTFAFSANAPRSLRAVAGAVIASLFIALARLLRPAAPRPTTVLTPAERGRVATLAGLSRKTSAYLALLGDKLFLFSETGRSFIMYGVAGRSWVAMGDPVGERAEWEELVWQYREMCDRYGGWTVFYKIGTENIPLYLDLGLTLLKIGEEAIVPLQTFAIDGKSRRGLRRICNRFQREGYTFEVIPAGEVPAILPRLREISDAWLKAKKTREKRFSLGFFDSEYFQHFPFAVVRKDGVILAFCNIWQGAGKEELSGDLMRRLPDAQDGTMEYLFVQLMLWGKDQGYRWFNLGMAPLSGLELRSLAPTWTKLGVLIYRYGEHFYNFKGLRKYKEKFGPQWEPRYIACPGGFVSPRVIANVASLISGGMKGVIGR
jgi:phosphatidylglycerol lysyltransferase